MSKLSSRARCRDNLGKRKVDSTKSSILELQTLMANNADQYQNKPNIVVTSETDLQRTGESRPAEVATNNRATIATS